MTEGLTLSLFSLLTGRDVFIISHPERKSVLSFQGGGIATFYGEKKNKKNLIFAVSQ